MYKRSTNACNPTIMIACLGAPNDWIVYYYTFVSCLISQQSKLFPPRCWDHPIELFPEAAVLYKCIYTWIVYKVSKGRDRFLNEMSGRLYFGDLYLTSMILHYIIISMCQQF